VHMAIGVRAERGKHLGAGMNIIAITTSVNYSDYLRFCLESLAHVVDGVVVVTDQHDSAIDMAERFAATPLVFDAWHKDGAKFNKAGAIRYAQEKIYAAHPDAWYLVIDADIVMEQSARQVIEEHATDEAALYSARRVDFHTQAELRAGTPTKTYGGMFAGCWQLYRRHVLYPEWSRSAEGCDLSFAAQFASARVLPMVVGHCGKEAVNWEGRCSPMW
jgi:hypothetical protein